MAKRFLSNIRINDAYTFPASDGTNNQVIKTDGSGNLSFGQLAADSASVMYKDTFTGDGSTTGFTLSNALNDEVQSNIYIDGVYQSKSTYSVSGTAITFSTAPLSGHEIEVISTTGINSGPTAIYTDTFTANGSATAFTLGQTVHSENQTIVFLNGVYQFKGTYTLSGTTLTLDTAPSNGVSIEVMSIGSAYSGGDILYDHDFTSAGLMTTNGSGVYSITANNSANWNTAYGWGDHSTQSYATQSYVGTQISNLVDSSPATLNTLNELAAALGDDPNFATTTANSIGTKLPLAGGTLTGGLTGTTAGFSGSITASGNSNSFGNTTIAALSASTGTFSASVTAAGNSNSFGTSTFTGTVTTENIFQVYSTGVSLVIGAIGNTANDLNIYSTTNGHNGLRMHANGILPTDNTGTIIDNDADLGDVSYRFKNLYLGGSITSGGGATFAGTVQTTQITATNGLNYLKRNTDASLQLRSENTRSGLFITKPATDTVMGSALVLASDESYRLGTASYYHMVMLQNGNTYFNQNVGIGLTNPSWQLEVSDTGTVRNAITSTTNGTAGVFFRVFNSGTQVGNGTIRTDNAGNMDFWTGTTGESIKMSITDGGNVLIGTVTNTAKLNVGGKLKITDDLIMAQTNGRIDYDNGVSSGALRFFSTSGNTERMRITSAGSVGIGTTLPSAPLDVWGSGADGTALLRLTGSAGSQAFNWISSVVYPNLASGKTAIKLFGHSQGANNQAYVGFKYAGSGSTNNTLTFGFYANNFLVNLLANGNFGIGTTTVQNKFVVRDTGSSFNSTIQTSTVSIISKEMTDNAYHSILQLVAVRQSLVAGKDSNGYLGFSTVDDSNNQGQLDAGRIAIVNEAGSSRNSATALSFWTNPGGTQTTAATEKMRINSAGFLKASNSGSYDNATSTVHELVSTSNGGQIAKFTHGGTVPYGMQIRYSQVSPNITDNYFFIGSDSTANRIIIWGNGNVQNQNNSYGALSDIKLKENIVDATPKLDDLMKVKIRNFNLIGDDSKQIGVIAQEIEKVFPSLVEDVKEQGSEETTKSVKYSVLVPIMLKAIQELKADNDSLKARMETLENN